MKKPIYSLQIFTGILLIIGWLAPINIVNNILLVIICIMFVISSLINLIIELND